MCDIKIQCISNLNFFSTFLVILQKCKFKNYLNQLYLNRAVPDKLAEILLFKIFKVSLFGPTLLCIQGTARRLDILHLAPWSYKYKCPSEWMDEWMNDWMETINCRCYCWWMLSLKGIKEVLWQGAKKAFTKGFKALVKEL